MQAIAMKTVCGVVLSVSVAGLAEADLVITEVMSNSSHPGGSSNGDWWELTNAGSAAVDLEGYYWDDGGPTANDGAVFPAFTLAAGQSLVIVDEADASAFVADWGGGFTALVGADFGGPDTFSGLSSGGDQIELWTADPNVNPGLLPVASAVFGESTDGVSFAWDLSGNALGLSVAGQNGAFVAFSDGATLGAGPGTDVGSPGVVPEPASLALIGLGGMALLGRRRAR